LLPLPKIELTEVLRDQILEEKLTLMYPSSATRRQFLRCAAGFAAAACADTSDACADPGSSHNQTSTILGGISPGAAYEKVMADMSSADLHKNVDLMKKAGATFVRINSPSQNGTEVTGQFDAIVTAVLAQGMTPLMTLQDRTKEWGSARDSFATWCKYAAEHYRGMGVQHYEIGNEVNMHKNWASGAVSPSGYAQCLMKAFANIKTVDSSSVVLTSGLATQGRPGDGGPHGLNQIDFLDQIYKGGIAGHFDAANVHPYCSDNFNAKDPNSGYPTEESDYNPWHVMPQMHQIMTANGDGAKKIWYTEFGVPTGVDGGRHQHTQEQQARAIELAFQVAHLYTFSGPLFSFSWFDTSGDGDFGLYNHQGAPKPALSAYRTALR
jgi:hypothetical protein